MTQSLRLSWHLALRTVFFLTVAFLYLPLLYLIFQTFLYDPNHWQSGLSLRWVERLLSSTSLWSPLLESLHIGFLSATLSVALACFGAVGLSKYRYQFPAWIESLILLPMLLPEVITGLSLLLFFLMVRIPLGFWTVVLAHASFSTSFVFFILYEQLMKLDPMLAEAAQDLGAKPQEVFWKVTLPNILPGIWGGWLLAFTLSFDDFLISFLTSGASVTTLPLKVYSLMRTGVSGELNGLSFFMISLSTLLVLILVSQEEGKRWADRK